MTEEQSCTNQVQKDLSCATEARLGDERQACQEEQTKGLLYQTLVDIKIKMNKRSRQ